MIRYLLRRFLTMAVTLLVISALVFFIIKLPPGDFLTNQIAELRAQGEAAAAPNAQFLNPQ
jgi:peptide/nickel transport system permease protein